MLPSSSRRGSRRDGVEVLLETQVRAVRWADAGFTLTLEGRALPADAVLVASGRMPRVDGLALDAGRREHTPRAASPLTIDFKRRTRGSTPLVMSARATSSRTPPTRWRASPSAMRCSSGARAFRRCRFPGARLRRPKWVVSARLVTRPCARGVEAVTIPLSSVDRAVVDEATDGFVRLYHRRGRIVGATVVAPAAGELVSAVALAMSTVASRSRICPRPCSRIRRCHWPCARQVMRIGAHR